MSNEKLKECPICLRDPCSCLRGGGDVADNKVSDTFKEQKSANVLVMPQRPLLLKDVLLKASFGIMVSSRSSFFPAILPSKDVLSSKNRKKQPSVSKPSDNEKTNDEKNDSVADTKNTPAPTSITS